MTKDELIQKIQDLTNALNDMDNRIRSGEELDLDGLDDRVELLCAQIEAAPAEISKAAEGAMAEMITALEKLAETLKQRTENKE